MKLIFDEKALVDLESIYSWIAKDNPAAAKAVVERLFASAEHLASFPKMGHVGRDARTFEWVVPGLPYIVIYEVAATRGAVIVTAVMHGAQDREGGL